MTDRRCNLIGKDKNVLNDQVEETGRVLPLRASLALWLRNEAVVLVRKRSKDDWEVPSTAVADGEAPVDAARRLAQMLFGLALDEQRLTGISPKDLIGTVHFVAHRVMLDETEIDLIPTRDIAGTHEVMIVDSAEIRQFLPKKRDRRLAS